MSCVDHVFLVVWGSPAAGDDDVLTDKDARSQPGVQVTHLAPHVVDHREGRYQVQERGGRAVGEGFVLFRLRKVLATLCTLEDYIFALQSQAIVKVSRIMASHPLASLKYTYATIF